MEKDRSLSSLGFGVGLGVLSTLLWQHFAVLCSDKEHQRSHDYKGPGLAQAISYSPEASSEDSQKAEAKRRNYYDKLLHRRASREGIDTLLDAFIDLLERDLRIDLDREEIERIWKRAFGSTSLDAGNRNVSFDEFNKRVQEVAFLKLLLRELDRSGGEHFSVPTGYDFTKSTNDNYAATPDTYFGDFQDIRAARDYSYHVNYSRERQLWQDRAVSSVVSRTAPQISPWIVYTCGPMGAGKGYALSWMSRHGYFPLEDM